MASVCEEQNRSKYEQLYDRTEKREGFKGTETDLSREQRGPRRKETDKETEMNQ